MEVQFVLPTVGTASAMTKDDQFRLLLNQAAAVVLTAYLEHATQVYIKSGDTDYRFDKDELVTLIDNVQKALNTI